MGVETDRSGLDGGDDIPAIAAAALDARAWECVVIGGGVRRGDLKVRGTVFDVP